MQQAELSRQREREKILQYMKQKKRKRRQSDQNQRHHQLVDHERRRLALESLSLQAKNISMNKPVRIVKAKANTPPELATTSLVAHTTKKSKRLNEVTTTQVSSGVGAVVAGSTSVQKQSTDVSSSERFHSVKTVSRISLSDSNRSVDTVNNVSQFASTSSVTTSVDKNASFSSSHQKLATANTEHYSREIHSESTSVVESVHHSARMASSQNESVLNVAIAKPDTRGQTHSTSSFHSQKQIFKNSPRNSNSYPLEAGSNVGAHTTTKTTSQVVDVDRARVEKMLRNDFGLTGVLRSRKNKAQNSTFNPLVDYASQLHEKLVVTAVKQEPEPMPKQQPSNPSSPLSPTSVKKACASLNAVRHNPSPEPERKTEVLTPPRRLSANQSSQNMFESEDFQDDHVDHYPHPEVTASVASKKLQNIDSNTARSQKFRRQLTSSSDAVNDDVPPMLPPRVPDTQIDAGNELLLTLGKLCLINQEDNLQLNAKFQEEQRRLVETAKQLQLVGILEAEAEFGQNVKRAFMQLQQDLKTAYLAKKETQSEDTISKNMLEQYVGNMMEDLKAQMIEHLDSRTSNRKGSSTASRSKFSKTVQNRKIQSGNQTTEYSDASFDETTTDHLIEDVDNLLSQTSTKQRSRGSYSSDAFDDEDETGPPASDTAEKLKDANAQSSFSNDFDEDDFDEDVSDAGDDLVKRKAITKISEPVRSLAGESMGEYSEGDFEDTVDDAKDATKSKGVDGSVDEYSSAGFEDTMDGIVDVGSSQMKASGSFSEDFDEETQDGIENAAGSKVKATSSVSDTFGDDDFDDDEDDKTNEIGEASVGGYSSAGFDDTEDGIDDIVTSKAKATSSVSDTFGDDDFDDDDEDDKTHEIGEASAGGYSTGGFDDTEDGIDDIATPKAKATSSVSDTFGDDDFDDDEDEDDKPDEIGEASAGGYSSAGFEDTEDGIDDIATPKAKASSSVSGSFDDDDFDDDDEKSITIAGGDDIGEASAGGYSTGGFDDTEDRIDDIDTPKGKATSAVSDTFGDDDFDDDEDSTAEYGKLSAKTSASNKNLARTSKSKDGKTAVETSHVNASGSFSLEFDEEFDDSSAGGLEETEKESKDITGSNGKTKPNTLSAISVEKSGSRLVNKQSVLAESEESVRKLYGQTADALKQNALSQEGGNSSLDISVRDNSDVSFDPITENDLEDDLDVLTGPLFNKADPFSVLNEAPNVYSGVRARNRGNQIDQINFSSESFDTSIGLATAANYSITEEYEDDPDLHESMDDFMEDGSVQRDHLKINEEDSPYMLTISTVAGDSRLTIHPISSTLARKQIIINRGAKNEETVFIVDNRLNIRPKLRYDHDAGEVVEIFKYETVSTKRALQNHSEITATRILVETDLSIDVVKNLVSTHAFVFIIFNRWTRLKIRFNRT